MRLDIDWTTVAASAVTSAIIGGTQFVSNRYLAKVLDRIEHGMGLSKTGKNGNGGKKNGGDGGEEDDPGLSP